jgi:hypothetical protein
MLALDALRSFSLATGVLVSAALAVSMATGPVADSGAGPAAGAAVVRDVAAGYPTNAAKIFRWGDAQWNDEFIGPMKPMWSINRRSLVRNQNGMLTINATATSGTVSATVFGHARRYGRWEARVRAEQYSTGARPYRVVWELVPTSGYHCGARSIVLAQYALGTRRARMHLRKAGRQFTAGKVLNLRPGPFHTYAVEVTRTHISWFVDTRVLRTERRSTARTGARYAVRFRLVGASGARMNPGRMQMDWMRHYSLARPNARSIRAPQARLERYAGAC